MDTTSEVNDTSATGKNELLAHERLDAYRVGLEFMTLAHGLIGRLPKTKGQLGDQLERAAESVLLRMAEGAGAEWRSAEQKRFFRSARGSVLECAAVLDICRIRGVVSADQLTGGRQLLLRLVRMLTKLCREDASRLQRAPRVGPLEGLGENGVEVVDEGEHLLPQVVERTEVAAAQQSTRQDAEPGFDLI